MVQSGRGRLEAGNRPPKKRKTFIDVDKRIIKIIEDYNNCNMHSFLKGIVQKISCY